MLRVDPNLHWLPPRLREIGQPRSRCERKAMIFVFRGPKRPPLHSDDETPIRTSTDGHFGLARQRD